MTYEITKRFISGNLKGVTITEQTNVRYEVGFVCRKAIGGSGYVIEAVKTIKS